MKEAKIFHNWELYIIIIISYLPINIRAQNKIEYYQNPIIINKKSRPDVCVWKGENGFYNLLYTHVFGQASIYQSKDLINWSESNLKPYNQQTIKQLKQLASKEGFKESASLWAPNVVKIKDKWNLYTSIANHVGIIVLQSDSPNGPFHFPGEPTILISPKSLGWKYDAIDPCVVQDNDGSWYIFFGSSFGIYRAKLTNDGLKIAKDSKFTHVIGPTSPNNIVENKKHGGYEGVFLYKYKNWWYCFVSKRTDYSIYVGRSKTLTGEFLDRNGLSLKLGYGTRINYGTEGFEAPGHNGEIFQDKKGKYYIFYHAKTGEGSNKIYGLRQIILSELIWDEDGFPHIKNYKAEKENNIKPEL